MFFIALSANDTITPTDFNAAIGTYSTSPKDTGEGAQECYNGDPSLPAILEFTYSSSRHTLLVNNLLIEGMSSKSVLELCHGKNKFDIYSGGLRPRHIRTDLHCLYGGYIHTATIRRGEFVILSKVPLPEEGTE